MTQRIQIYWEQADWALLAAYLAKPTKQPFKLSVDHNYFEDIRKRIWLLEHIHAGYYTGEGWVQVGVPADYAENRFRAGKKLVTVEDDKYGTTWWVNYKDVTFGDYYYAGSPPTDIHPSDNKWIAKKSIWALYPNPNKYHHYDTNAIHTYIDSTVIGSIANDNLKKNVIDLPGHKLYPRQVDSRMQYPIIYYKDVKKFAAQYKEKVAFDRKFITQPDTLGPVYTAWRYRQKGPAIEIVVKDAWGLKSIGGYAGNQYANINNTAALDDAASNSPGGGIWGAGNYPDRQPNTGARVEATFAEWSWNPKNNHAYQNKIEILLSMKFRLPAGGDSVYVANFRNKYDYAENFPNDPSDSFEEWFDYDDVNSELWGENESGFELFLKKSDTYDWYFDYDFTKQFTGGSNLFLVYTPSEIVIRVLQRVINEGLDWETAVAAYDLTSVGSWRRTWKYSLGRVSPYMRSYEMGEPDRKDTWNPDVGEWDKAARGDWYGSRKETWPRINEFDNRSKTILPTTDEFVFKLDGDGTAYLKVGWLVHLTTSTSQRIYDGANWIPAAYISEISYDTNTDKTTIKTTERYTGYNLVMWNKEISERHDAGQVIQSLDSDSKTVIEPEHELTAYVVKEMRDLLLLSKYGTAVLSLDDFRWGHWLRSNKTLETDGAVAWIAKYHAEVMAEFNWDPPSWPGGPGMINDVGSYISAAWHWSTLRSQWETTYNGAWPGCDLSFAACAFKPTLYLDGGQSKPISLSDIGHEVMLMIGHRDSLDLSGQPDGTWPLLPEPKDGVPKFKQTVSGITNSIATSLADQWFRYHYIALKPRAGSNYLFMLPEVNHATWMWEPDGGPLLYNFAGVCEMGIEIFLPDNAAYKYDWETVPVSVWAFDWVGHIDAPKAPIIDTEPPRPNPPVFHSKPQAYFVLVPEQGGLGDVDYIPEHFELFIKAESVLCQDYAGSDPVKYRIVGEDNAPSGEWTTKRTCVVKIRELSMQEAERETKRTLPNVATTKPSGTITRFTFEHSKGISVGDTLVFEGLIHTDGEQIVVAVDTGGTYFDIDKRFYIVETPSNGTIYNKSKGFDTLDWQYELARNYKFALRAKDSNVPHNNIGKLSDYILVAEPETYPMELV